MILAVAEKNAKWDRPFNDLKVAYSSDAIKPEEGTRMLQIWHCGGEEGGSQLENLSLKSFRWVGPATRGGREPTTDQTDVGCVWSVNPISMRSASTNRLWPSTPVVNSSPVLQYSSSLCFDCFWAIFPPCFRSIDTPLVLLCGGIGKHWICRWFRANTSMILIWH